MSCAQCTICFKCYLIEVTESIVSLENSCCMLLIWQFIKYFFAARYLWITFSPLWIVCIHHLLNLSLNFLASIRDTNKKQTRTFKSPSCKIYKMHRVEKSCRNLSWWTLKNILIHSANPLNQNAKSSSISTRNKKFTRITYETW